MNVDESGNMEAARRRTVFCMSASGLAAILLPIAGGFQVAFLSYWPSYMMAAVLAAFLPYLWWRKMDKLVGCVETAALMFLALVITVVLTFSAMRLNMPMADITLQRMDAALGLSSIEALRLIKGYPNLSWTFAISYTAFGYEILLLGPLLAICIDPARAYMFVTAFLILIVLSALVSIAFPSHGAIIAQGHFPSDFSYINYGSAQGFIENLDAVRNDPNFILSLENSSGIVTFPSIHAGVAVLCALAAWPSRILRWPLILLNGLMFASAITSGSHYFVDVIAGGLLAACSFKLASVERWLPHRSTLPASVRLTQPV
jgi:membrane-associated phospholipid phosphatase